MKRVILLWLLLLGGPAVWFLSMNVNFALAPWACAWNWKPVLYCVSAAALVITALLSFSSWSQWQSLGREYPGEAGGEISSSRALASGAVLLNAMFFLVVLGQSIVELILGACQ